MSSRSIPVVWETAATSPTTVLRALVVDPQRDFDRVEELLAEHGLTLTHVAETHIHNDYVTGGLRTRAPARCDLRGAGRRGTGLSTALAVRDGDSFTVGDMTVDVIHTPGHTPHHVSFAVRKGDHLGAVFTGGSLLYGSVGRPDLVAPDLAVKQAHDQWHSVRRLADTLDDADPDLPHARLRVFLRCDPGAGPVLDDRQREDHQPRADRGRGGVRGHSAGRPGRLPRLLRPHGTGQRRGSGATSTCRCPSRLIPPCCVSASPPASGWWTCVRARCSRPATSPGR